MHLSTAVSFMRHWLHAQSRYAVHSPFAYEFVTRVLPHRNSPEGKRIDQFRKKLKRDRSMLGIRDFGAGYGGKSIPEIQKSMRAVVKSSARGRREGELLFRLCRHYQPVRGLELGTNLGFSTLYLLSGHPGLQLSSVEGSPVLVEYARRHLGEFDLQADLRCGEFSEVLDKLLAEQPAFDLILLDGNHRKTATLEYFRRLLPYTQPGAMVIVDDIRWSQGMQEAWQAICGFPEVSLSIDLFTTGICFLNRPQARTGFRFRFRPF